MRTAAYARYSSDQQRDSSIEDQLRNIRGYCARQGWPAPAVYSDAAISGSREDRPGYRMLLSETASGRFDVLLVDDLSRLSRDSAETAKTIKRLSFSGVRLIGVSDGVDTARKGHKIDVGLRGLMSDLYLDDLADKTHRGLSGRALSGASAGGLPFGYRVTSTGQRAIDETQAAAVRRIFSEFNAGLSPRSIAAGLNRDGVPTARGAPWCMTAIYGDLKRGIGILANPIYIGRQIWNRSRWIKHPDTGRRQRVERPESEWIITEHPELAVVDRNAWELSQGRLRGTRAITAKGKARGGNHSGKYLLSGLLRCEDCGGPLVVVDYYRYGCAAAKDRGATVCGNQLKVSRVAIERAVLATVKQDLLTEEAFRLFESEVRRALKEAAPDIEGGRRAVTRAEQVQQNLMAALRAGIITPSTKAELLSAEADLERARIELKALKDFQPAQMLPRARETFRRMVDTLETISSVPEARQALRELLGERIVITKKAGDIFAEVPAFNSEISLVAGAGFEPTTFGL